MAEFKTFECTYPGCSKKIGVGFRCNKHQFQAIPSPLPGFDWPCDKREAHGPHPIEPANVRGNCPGVKAHPATQIGGNHISERPVQEPVLIPQPVDIPPHLLNAPSEVVQDHYARQYIEEADKAERVTMMGLIGSVVCLDEYDLLGEGTGNVICDRAVDHEGPHVNDEFGVSW